MAPKYRHALFICDIQEGFRNAIHEFPTVISTAQKLLTASTALSLPVIVTTQNASRLGPTVSELTPLLSPFPSNPTVLLNEDKTLFSMLTPTVHATLAQHLHSPTSTLPSSEQIHAVAIAGIESHVCILQTVLDLRKAGVNVYVIQDGVSSCNKEEIPIALHRMRQVGAVVTTSESWLYEVMGDAAISEFREILKVVKNTKESTKDGLARLCKSSL